MHSALALKLITGKTGCCFLTVFISWYGLMANPKMKISENVEKMTLPGIKKVVRYYDEEGYFYRDGILLESETVDSADIIYHPVYPEKKYENLLIKKKKNYKPKVFFKR